MRDISVKELQVEEQGQAAGDVLVNGQKMRLMAPKGTGRNLEGSRKGKGGKQERRRMRGGKRGEGWMGWGDGMSDSRNADSEAERRSHESHDRIESRESD